MSFKIMPGRCIVGGCCNTSKDGVSMHTFPKDVALRKIWTARVKLTRAKWYGPTDSSIICSAHFDESAFQTGLYSQFELSRLRRLTAEAIPSKIKNKSVADGAEKPERKAFKKRQQKQVIKNCYYLLTWPKVKVPSCRSPCHHQVVVISIHMNV